MTLEDLLCDKCLHMVESSPPDTVSFTDDLCDRCRAKAYVWIAGLYDEFEKQFDRHEKILEEWKP